MNKQDPLWTSNPLIGNGNFATQYRLAPAVGRAGLDAHAFKLTGE